MRPMSVYTQLQRTDIERILSDYDIGSLLDFEGISAGIENSNFFITTERARYVLTLFERMTDSELPYFMALMHHLSKHGLCSPQVQLRHDETSLFTFTASDGSTRQGCIVSCLPGKVERQLSQQQLNSAGQALATMHQAARDFPLRRSSPSDLDWLQQHIIAIGEQSNKAYGKDIQSLLNDELRHQQAIDYRHLPTSVIHGDFFRDNMLFSGQKVSGVIDLYYAHDAACALDIAIAINALSMDIADAENERAAAFLAGYAQVRQLQREEWQALPDLLRLAALRFWVSRLYDACFPREGDMTTTLDPEEYRLKLNFHRTNPDFSQQLQTNINKEG